MDKSERSDGKQKGRMTIRKERGRRRRERERERERERNKRIDIRTAAKRKRGIVLAKKLESF